MIAQKRRERVGITWQGGTRARVCDRNRDESEARHCTATAQRHAPAAPGCGICSASATCKLPGTAMSAPQTRGQIAQINVRLKNEKKNMASPLLTLSLFAQRR